ncbi:hypothetical protein ACSSUR_16355 [Pseudomonas cedrina]|uniref:hypothetical protein n=1 Tax=Pseudomonas cedrina TaxID=651740 RepID=UPI003ED987CC
MSQKINVWFILARHYRSAILDSSSESFSISDFFIFIVIPLLTSVLVFNCEISDRASTISLLTSVCAIFAGLLLNLLVLVYDQNKRVSEKLVALADKNRGRIQPASSIRELQQTSIETPDDSLIRRFTLQKSLLSELVVNISYSIIISVFSAVLCMVAYLTNAPKVGNAVVVGLWQSVLSFDYKNLLFSASVFLTANLVLTLLMIVKRVFKLMDDE